jgi:hypothetical protein
LRGVPVDAENADQNLLSPWGIGASSTMLIAAGPHLTTKNLRLTGNFLIAPDIMLPSCEKVA